MFIKNYINHIKWTLAKQQVIINHSDYLTYKTIISDRFTMINSRINSINENLIRTFKYYRHGLLNLNLVLGYLNYAIQSKNEIIYNYIIPIKKRINFDLIIFKKCNVDTTFYYEDLCDELKEIEYNINKYNSEFLIKKLKIAERLSNMEKDFI